MNKIVLSVTWLLMLLAVSQAFVTPTRTTLQPFTLHHPRTSTSRYAVPPVLDVDVVDDDEVAIMECLKQRRTERRIKSVGLAIGATFVGLSVVGEAYLLLSSPTGSSSAGPPPLALLAITLVIIGAVSSTVLQQEIEQRLPLSSDLQNAMAQGGRDGTTLGVKDGRGLIVKEDNTGRGMGLFATEDISSGDFLMEYRGENINEEELLRRYGPDFVGDYVFELGADLFEDATDPAKSNLARYMNHECSNSTKCNVQRIRQKWPELPRVLFFAARDIAEGEQLCFDYGPDYWTGREHLLL